MLPSGIRLDPDGYYACLGLQPAASADAITAAFRRKARVLHPDVPGTGNTAAFVAARRAYEVLSNRESRATYDRLAREVAATAGVATLRKPSSATGDPAWFATPQEVSRPSYETTTKLYRRPQFSDLPMAVWLGLGAFLCLCLLEAVLHLRAPAPVISDGIRPNAALVTPLPDSAEHVMLYGPAPVRLAGVPNRYVVPSAGATVLWRQGAEHDAVIPVGQLPPFSSVEALRQSRQTGLAEVRYTATTNGFIDATHLMPGDVVAARRAYCGYNAGSAPVDGERLQQRGSGSGVVRLANPSMQPMVVKLRDASGAAALSVFLAPGSQMALSDVPNGLFRADFAVGELWSRACHSFAAGMRARRMASNLMVMPQAQLILPADDDPTATDISDQSFERD